MQGPFFGRRMQDIEPNEKTQTTGDDQETDDPQHKWIVLKPYHAVAEQIKPSITKGRDRMKNTVPKALLPTKTGHESKSQQDDPTDLDQKGDPNQVPCQMDLSRHSVQIQ